MKQRRFHFANRYVQLRYIFGIIISIIPLLLVIPAHVCSTKWFDSFPSLDRECLVPWCLETGFLPILLVTQRKALQPPQCGCRLAPGSELRAANRTSFCCCSGGPRTLPFLSRTFHTKRCLGMSPPPLESPAEIERESIFLFPPTLQACLSWLAGDPQYSWLRVWKTELIGMPQRI